MGFVKCLVPICSQLADYTYSTTAVFIMEKSEISGNTSWSRESVVVAVKGIIRVSKLQRIYLFYYLLDLRELANSNDVHKNLVGALF